MLLRKNEFEYHHPNKITINTQGKLSPFLSCNILHSGNNQFIDWFSFFPNIPEQRGWLSIVSEGLYACTVSSYDMRHYNGFYCDCSENFKASQQSSDAITIINT